MVLSMWDIFGVELFHLEMGMGMNGIFCMRVSKFPFSVCGDIENAIFVFGVSTMPYFGYGGKILVWGQILAIFCMGQILAIFI